MASEQNCTLMAPTPPLLLLHPPTHTLDPSVATTTCNASPSARIPDFSRFITALHHELSIPPRRAHGGVVDHVATPRGPVPWQLAFAVAASLAV